MFEQQSKRSLSLLAELIYLLYMHNLTAVFGVQALMPK
jgi:hypothetical protein